MTTLRPAALAALALVLPVLVACGADDAVEPTAPVGASDRTETPDGPDGDPGEAGGSSPDALEGEPCRAEVTVTGAVEASWGSEGTVAPAESIAPVTYESADGDDVVTVYGAGKGFKLPSLIFRTGATVYGTEADATGIEVDRDGGGADVDADLVGFSGGAGDSGVHVTATFSC
ncbi:hypothetical protein FE634_04870 [Nocardioides dongxiaopingii]|uniref:hypothetical protein n=1 Tax=Nocardioides sp. S-1144 TaxID=2582905 RepID=UPI00110D7C00|nr:hypothetical protein [Nocardioides sp. S-1144]QCW49913.1 hypothetical protein FE634_04870 [Nocardioides sp. S-1144]